jgi:glutathione-regulated potassium-efflux system ancillary protein KefF
VIRAECKRPDANAGGHRRHAQSATRKRRSHGVERHNRATTGIAIMICVIHAHPYLSRSRTNRALAAALRGAPGIELRALYDLYPDFDIDVAAEQRALQAASLIVWMHPIYWYSTPSLLQQWFEKVLAIGWAYGEGGTALRGKHCLWVPTTGGEVGDYTVSGLHAHAFTDFSAPIEQTARFCEMHWETPYVVHAANTLDEAGLAAHAAALLRRFEPWQTSDLASLSEATS